MLHLLLGDLPHDFPGQPDHQRARRDDSVLLDQTAGAEDRVFADARAAENDRAHSDQRVVADLNAVQDHAVADRDAAPHHERRADVDVDAAVVLHVALIADRDRRVVAANRDAKPDADVFAEAHVANDGRVVRDHRIAAALHAANHVGIDAELAVFGNHRGYIQSRKSGQNRTRHTLIALCIACAKGLTLYLLCPKAMKLCSEMVAPPHFGISQLLV